MSNTTDHPRELSQADLDRLVDEGRDVHLGKYLAETDQSLANALAEKYQLVVPSSRIEMMLSLPTEFEDRERFDQALTPAGGEPKEGERVLGYSRFDTEPAHVAVDHLEIPKTIAHERLHQLSDPRSLKELGQSLYEGVTEDLAIVAIGAESPITANRCYPVERAIAREMRDLAGSDAVEQAYFLGDSTELRRRLDERLGPDGLERLQRQITELTEQE